MLLPYSSARVAKIKSFVGLRWHQPKQYLTVPQTNEAVTYLRTLFTGKLTEVDPSPDNAEAPQQKKPFSESHSATFDRLRDAFPARHYARRTDQVYGRLALHLGLVLLAGLSGCGSPTLDEAAPVGPHAIVGEMSPMGTVSRDTGACPPPGCVARLHGRGAGALTQGLTLPGQRLQANPPSLASGTEAVPLPEHLVLSRWMDAALASPEVPVRLRALDIWAQQGSDAPLDPLVMALEDADDDVRMEAMAMIEQHWAGPEEAEPPGYEAEQEEMRESP